MRRLNSQFKRSSLSNPKTFTRNQVALAVTLATTVMTSLSTCRNRPETKPEITDQVANTKEQALIEVNSEVTPTWIPMRDSSQDKGDIFTWIGGKSCIESHLTLKSNLVTAVGNTEFVIDQSWDQSSSNVQIDTLAITTPVSVLTSSQKDALCNAIRAGISPVVLPSDIGNQLKAGIERVVASIGTDCSNVQSTNEGWRCSLKTLMPQSAIIQAEEFQQTMIKRWSRQPYIIARKAGVTMSLARIATNITAQEPFNKFCKLLQFSLPEELPLVMTSPSWQKSLCDGPEKDRREIAFHGLAKSIEELAILRQLYENTSKVGVFSVRIPDKEIPSRAPFGPQPFRVTITPDQEVTDRLVEVASTMLGRPLNTPGRRLRNTASVQSTPIALDLRKPACWHPVFSDTPALLRVAEGLRLTGEGFKGECHSTLPATPTAPGTQDVLAKYLMQSLASETEFVMDNGQSKLLRLPEGSYKYTVHVLPQNPIDAEESSDESAPESTGNLSWGSAKNHSIKNW